LYPIHARSPLNITARIQ